MRTPKKILDRRRSVRIEESLPFKIGCNGYEVEARTVNISMSGVMCLVDKDIALMTKVKLVLELGKSMRIRTDGVVVRKEKDLLSSKIYLALFFSDLKPADEEKLQKYIQKRLAP